MIVFWFFLAFFNTDSYFVQRLQFSSYIHFYFSFSMLHSILSLISSTQKMTNASDSVIVIFSSSLSIRSLMVARVCSIHWQCDRWMYENMNFSYPIFETIENDRVKYVQVGMCLSKIAWRHKVIWILCGLTYFRNQILKSDLFLWERT